MELTISHAVFPVLKLSVDGKEYVLCFPLPSVIKAEDSIGKRLKSLQDWLDLESKHLPAIIEAGLAKYHPSIATDEVENILQNLTVEALDEIHYALCKLAFPRTMEKLEAERAKLQGQPEQTSPNV